MDLLGLPDAVGVCLFDLDGVLTDTAVVHAHAWKQMFDAYLAERDGAGFRPFDPRTDYVAYVDGKRRDDGTRSFLASRDIRLADAEVHELGDRKNALVHELIERDGVTVFDGSVDYVRRARAAGLRTAVVSSSANTGPVLQVTGLADLFDTVVDGIVAVERGLPGKPAPDTFLAAARELGSAPDAAAVFEDAIAGVDAGRAGAFGFVVGVNRGDAAQGAALTAHGADRVVNDLAELLDD